MRTLMIVAASALSLGVAGCTTTERNTATGAALGAAGGAVVGAAVTGDAEGALVGAAVGGVAGAVTGNLIGRSAEPGRCIYEDRRTGERFVDVCPAG